MKNLAEFADELAKERDEWRTRAEQAEAALRTLSEWSLPRWEPDNPQTEGEQMRLYALAATTPGEPEGISERLLSNPPSGQHEAAERNLDRALATPATTPGEPPPFNPDPALIYDRGSGKKPSAGEVEKACRPGCEGDCDGV